MREALFGGDLFSVATYFYQNHKLDSRPKEAIKETLQFPCMQKAKKGCGGGH